MTDRGKSNHRGGYKRPPPWGQFRKGKSGNPKGRPRKKRELPPDGPDRPSDRVLKELMDRTYEVDENGRKRKVTMHEVIRRKQIALATGGNVHAIRHVNSDVEKMEAREAARARAEAEAEEEARKDEADRQGRLYAHAKRLKEAQARKWKEAIEAGKSEPDEPWPHPDDILLDSAMRTVRVRGPIDAEGVERAERIRDERDHNLAEMVLAIRNGLNPGIEKLWLGSLLQLDALLPKRWQIAHDLDPPMMRLFAVRFHKLDRLVEDGARRFGPRQGSLRRSKEEYRKANALFLPVIRALGYRSLKQFEHAIEQAGPASRQG